MRKRTAWRGVIWLVLVLSVCVMGFAGFKVWETTRVYSEGNESYAQLASLVRPAAPTLPLQTPQATDTPSDVPRLVLNAEIPYMEIDFEALQAISTDAVAWLYCPDTVIDYPVMQAKDYYYYLRRLPDGTRNNNGSLFIDYNNAPDFSDRLTVVYGHNMKSERMFGTLTKYKKQVYVEEHPYMYLYTEQGNYRIDLMYGCVIGAGEWRERAFMYEANMDALLAFAAVKTTFTSPAEYTEDDRVIVLSTCSYEFDDARYVVIGILQPEYIIIGQ